MPMLMTFICLASTVAGLFEDQAGGFDWRQSYMGQVRQLGSHTTSITSVLVVDSKKIGEAVRRVVKTSFHAGNIGEPSVGSVRTLSWCVRGGGGCTPWGVVTQGCESDNRDSQGQAYRKKCNQEIEVNPGSGVVSHTLGEESG